MNPISWTKYNWKDLWVFILFFLKLFKKGITTLGLVVGFVFILSYSILAFDTVSFSSSTSSLDESSLPNKTYSDDYLDTDGEMDLNSDMDFASSGESYSSGAEGGYEVKKPFVLNDGHSAGAYIGSDGYLYAGGREWGGSTGSIATFYKKSGAAGGSAGTIVDYDINIYYGITVDTSGVVRRGAKTTEESTTTWSTVTVGGVTSGHKAVSIARNKQMVVASTGAVYVSDDGATTMTSIAITSTVATANGGVKDIAMGLNYQYVLFNNGALYGGTAGTTSMSSIATGVTMFDFDSYNSTYIYIYNTSNQIRVAEAVGSGTHTFTTLVTEAGVKQITGAYSSTTNFAGWGYISSSNTFKRSSTYNGTSFTSVSNVAYIDSAYCDWGYLNTSGQMYLWTTRSSDSWLTPNTSPTLKVSGLDIPNLEGGITDISTTPPTCKRYCQKFLNK